MHSHGNISPRYQKCKYTTPSLVQCEWRHTGNEHLQKSIPFVGTYNVWGYGKIWHFCKLIKVALQPTYWSPLAKTQFSHFGDVIQPIKLQLPLSLQSVREQILDMFWPRPAVTQSSLHCILWNCTAWTNNFSVISLICFPVVCKDLLIVIWYFQRSFLKWIQKGEQVNCFNHRFSSV